MTAPERAAVHVSRSFWQGFATQAANPNLLVYFAAILPQFVDSRQPLPGQVAHPRGQLLRDRARVLSLYAALASRAGERAAPRFRRIAERGAGGLLIAAGAGSRRCAALERFASGRAREVGFGGGTRSFAIHFAEMAAGILT